MSTANGNGTTMLLGIGEKTFEVELYDTGTARELLACLPQTLSMSRWGDEFYGTLRTKIGYAGDRLRDVFEIGEVAMWPPGGAFCIFFGPTPASRGEEPRAALPVIRVGNVQGDWPRVRSLGATTRARLSAG